MNRQATEWAGVKVASVFGGSEAQARNVLQMALDDIAEIAADRDRFERNRDMWREQCSEQSKALTAANEKLAEEIKIVDRIWAQLGNPTYADLAGRSIFDLIDGLKAKATLTA